MSETGDLLFGKQLVAQGLVSGEIGAKLLQIQSILGQHQIQKSLADISVEAGWLEKDRANGLIDQINAAQPDAHPALNVAFSSPPLESAAQRAVQSGAIDRDRRQELATLKSALEEFGYRRTLGELSYDQGLIDARPSTEDDRPRNAPEAGTARTRPSGAATRPTRPGTAVKTPPAERRSPTAAKVPTAAKAPAREGTRNVARPATAVKPPTANKPSTAARTPTAIKPPTESKRKGTSTRGRTSELRAAGVNIAPPPKKKSPVLLISAGGLAAVVIIAVAVALNSSKPPVTDEPSTSPVAVSTNPKPTPRPTNTPVATNDPSPTSRPSVTKGPNPAAKEQDCDSYFFMAKSHAGAGKIDEALAVLDRIVHEYGETKFYKENHVEIEELVAKLKKEKAEGDGPEKPPTEKKDLTALKAAWEKKRAARAAEGQKKVDDALKAIEAERIAEENALAAMLKRVADKKMSIKLKNDQQLDNTVILKVSRDSFNAKFNVDGGEIETEYPWDWVNDRSFLEMQRALYGSDTATGCYEIGRACILRKLWRDAKSAFDACLKLDATFKDRVPDLTKILNNEAAFKGKAINPKGTNQLDIKYDFSDPEQSQDWSPRGGPPLEVNGGTATLNPRGTLLTWSLKDVDYENEVTVDAKVMLGAKSVFIIGTMFNWENKGVLVHIGPDGCSYQLSEGRGMGAPKKKGDEKVTGEAQVRFKFKEGKMSVTANGKEVFAAEDSTYTKGWLLLGSMGESVVLKNLVVSGKVAALEIQKRFAESEVLVRRALENDLNAKERPQRPDDEEDDLSVEDEYFKAQLSEEMLDEFKDCRKRIVRAQHRGSTVQQMKECVEGLGKVIEASPAFAAAFFWRSVANRMIREHEQSLKDLETAAKDPDFFEARTHLAYNYYYEFKFAETERYVGEALRIAPDDATALALRAELKYTKRLEPKAWKLDFETAVHLEPTDEAIRTRYKNVINEFKGPENLGCKHKSETKHFTVMTDISPAMTKLYGERLEAAFKHFSDTFKEFFKDDLTRPRARIAIFNTREAYFTYAELTSSDRKENTLGYFSPLNNELLLFEDVDMDETLHTLYHELFHKFMSLMIPRAPYWYNEGIAEYMGAIKIEKGVVVAKGQMLDGRIKSMKPYMRMALKFSDIMRQTPGEFYSGPVSFKYAQAWTMIHFFYEYQGGKHRHLIDSYYRNLLGGKSMNEAYDEVFGKVDIDALQNEWKGFAQGLEPSKP